MKIKLLPRNKKTEFTRMCIAEAIIDMLQTNPIDKIRISAVVKKAGVSRMTFYKYYPTVQDALEDYLHIIVSHFIEEANNTLDIGGYLDYSHILFALNFFDRYRTYFLVMNKNDLHGILLRGVNRFMSTQFDKANLYSTYELYCYSGGLLNAFLMWEIHNKKESAEDIAALLHRLYTYNPTS